MSLAVAKAKSRSQIIKASAIDKVSYRWRRAQAAAKVSRLEALEKDVASAILEIADGDDKTQAWGNSCGCEKTRTSFATETSDRLEIAWIEIVESGLLHESLKDEATRNTCKKCCRPPVPRTLRAWIMTSLELFQTQVGAIDDEE